MGSIKYCLTTAEPLFKPTGLLTLTLVAKILGAGPTALGHYTRVNLLVTLENPFDRRGVLIDPKSLVALLATPDRLPEWITPEAWIEAVSSETEPPLTDGVVAVAHLGINPAPPQELRDWLRQHQAWFMVSGRYTRVLTSWLNAYLKDNPRTA